jgi:hypothetical protein
MMVNSISYARSVTERKYPISPLPVETKNLKYTRHVSKVPYLPKRKITLI